MKKVLLRYFEVFIVSFFIYAAQSSAEAFANSNLIPSEYRYLKLIVEGTVGKEVRISEISFKSAGQIFPEIPVSSETQTLVRTADNQVTDWKAFDGTTGTGAWKVEYNFPSSIRIDIGERIIPAALILKVTGDNRGPSSFKVMGSNDDIHWALVHEESGLTKSNYTGKVGRFELDNLVPHAEADFQRPLPPQNIIVEPYDRGSVKISWDEASDNVGVVAYDIYQSYNYAATVSGTSYIFQGLNCKFVNGFRIVAKDAGNNASRWSELATGYTLPCGTDDLEPPTRPIGIKVNHRGPTSISFSWLPSTDNVGVEQYVIRRRLGGETFGITTDTSIHIEGLNCLRNNSFEIHAEDKAGNRSTSQKQISLSRAIDRPCPPEQRWYRYWRVDIEKAVDKEVRINEINLRTYDYKISDFSEENTPKDPILEEEKDRVLSSFDQKNAWLAFDGKTNTGTWKIEDNTPSSIIIDLEAENAVFPEGVIIHVPSRKYAPAAFSLWGSNDLKDWRYSVGVDDLKASDFQNNKYFLKKDFTPPYRLSDESHSDTNSIAKAKDIRTFPNPCNSSNCHLTVDFSGENWTSSRYRILSMEGKLMKRGRLDHTQQLNLSKFGKGLYIITFDNGTHQLTKKISVQ